MQTLTVVLLHVLKAFSAMDIASLVSAKPNSGIVPKISFVAGSVMKQQ